ncbi:MAG: alkaline phosphatase [Psychromonas sp.]|jgi:alkaline phosphatase
MYKKLVVSALTSVLSSVGFSAAAADLLNDQKTNSWYTQGEQVLTKKLAQKTNNKAKNVILFVGDGMGISTLTAARILQGQ